MLVDLTFFLCRLEAWKSVKAFALFKFAGVSVSSHLADVLLCARTAEAVVSRVLALSSILGSCLFSAVWGSYSVSLPVDLRGSKFSSVGQQGPTVVLA